MNGLIHIYCGEGKGKTTCATGLAIRMAGAGKKVVFARFLKDASSSELNILEKIEQIRLCLCEKCFGFFWNMTDEEKEDARQTYSGYFRETVRTAVEEQADMLVFDEMMAAYNHGLVNRTEVLEFLRNKPKGMEVVMTGREPDKELLELADYVSEIQKLKHPFDSGIAARIGIEK